MRRPRLIRKALSVLPAISLLIAYLALYSLPSYASNFSVEVSHYTGAGGTGWKDGDSKTSRFLWPRDVTKDSKGNIYVIDTTGLRRIDQAGNTTTLWKNNVNGQIFCSMSIDKSDVTWLLDCNGTQVVRINSDGRLLGSIQVAPSGNYSWVKPGMGFLPSGNLLLPSYGQGKLIEVSASGEVKDFLSGSTNTGCGTTPRLLGLICPISVAVSDSGRVYFVNQNSSNQWELMQLDNAKNMSVAVPANSQNGWSAYQIKFIGDQLYASQVNPSVLNDSCERKSNLSILQGNQFQTRISVPTFSDWDVPFTVEAQGNFVYALTSAGQVRKQISNSNDFLNIGSSNIGCENGLRASSKLVAPNAIAQDSNGNIYVKDDVTLRKIDSSGRVSTLYKADWIQRGGGKLVGDEFFMLSNENRLVSVNVNTGSVTQRQSFNNGRDYLSYSGKGYDVDSQGTLFMIVARGGSWSDKVLRKVSPSGQLTDILSFGSSDASILIDSKDNIYIASSNTIRKYSTRDFASSSIVSYYSGWGVVMSLDSDGSLFLFYSSNSNNNLQTNYFYKTKLGSASIDLVLQGGIGSDNSGSESTFNQVSDFVKVKSGEWLVADTGNHVIRSIKLAAQSSQASSSSTSTGANSSTNTSEASNNSESTNAKRKPSTPTFSGVNFVGNKINIDVNLGSSSSSRPDKIYLVAPRLGINSSNPLVGKIDGSTASWSIDFDKLLGGTMIPLEIVAEKDGVPSDPLIGSYQAPLITDAVKASSVPVAPKNFKSRVIGNSAVISVEATVKPGSLATGAHLFSNSLGISKAKALKGDVVGNKALIEVPIKISMAGKKYPVTIFLTNDKGESKPLNATLSIPAVPKSPSLPTAIPAPKVPKTVICARANQTRAFEGTTCPPGWEKR